jgi:hypothetical protein
MLRAELLRAEIGRQAYYHTVVGTLGGNGTVASTTVNNGGTLAPGNSIGTITINGNLVFGAGAIYRVEVSPAAADRTNVTGTATLGGTAQLVFQPGEYFSRSYTILSAAGGRTGTFNTVTTENKPAVLTASLTYTPTDVLLVTMTSNMARSPAPRRTRRRLRRRRISRSTTRCRRFRPCSASRRRNFPSRSMRCLARCMSRPRACCSTRAATSAKRCWAGCSRPPTAATWAQWRRSRSAGCRPHSWMAPSQRARLCEVADRHQGAPDGRAEPRYRVLGAGFRRLGPARHGW